MAYCKEFLDEGISISENDVLLLNQWYEETKDEKIEGLPRLMSYKEVCSTNYYSKVFEGFPAGKMIPLWIADHTSGIIGYYYEGPLSGMIFFDKGETNIAPKFQCLQDFLHFCINVKRIGLTIDEDDGYKEDEEFFETAFDYFDYKFWGNIDDERNYHVRDLSEEEKKNNYEIGKQLLNIWKSGYYPLNSVGDDNYEQLGFCIIKLISDEYCEELIPYLNKDESSYILGGICKKVADAGCIAALESLKKLFEIDGKEVFVGGYTNGLITKNAYLKLKKIIR